MTKITEKDKKEFIKLYEELHSSLSGFCRAKAYGIMDPKDLMSETLLKTLESFHKIKDKQAFQSYLFSVASNICHNHLRRKKFSSSIEVNSLVDLKTNQLNPEQILEIENLYQCLKKIPKREEEAILLFEISGFSIKEIMKIQNSSASAVKQRLRRGRLSLKKELEEIQLERA